MAQLIFLVPFSIIQWSLFQLRLTPAFDFFQAGCLLLLISFSHEETSDQSYAATSKKRDDRDETHFNHVIYICLVCDRIGDENGWNR